jgi:hypothetical protein
MNGVASNRDIRERNFVLGLGKDLKYKFLARQMHRATSRWGKHIRTLRRPYIISSSHLSGLNNGPGSRKSQHEMMTRKILHEQVCGVNILAMWHLLRPGNLRREDEITFKRNPGWN